MTFGLQLHKGHRYTLLHLQSCIYIPSPPFSLSSFPFLVKVSASPKGFRVVGIYGRKAKKPLTDALEPGADSWAMLGTNLSVKVRVHMYYIDQIY